MTTKTITPIEPVQAVPVYSRITDIDREKFFTNWNEALIKKIRIIKNK